MSVRYDKDTRKAFFKQVGKGLGGASILLILMGFWLGWDGFYYWFYNKLVHIPKEERVGDPLLIIWLLIMFPLLACGIAMLISGGIKAYKLAIPAKEKE